MADAIDPTVTPETTEDAATAPADATPLNDTAPASDTDKPVDAEVIPTEENTAPDAPAESAPEATESDTSAADAQSVAPEEAADPTMADGTLSVTDIGSVGTSDQTGAQDPLNSAPTSTSEEATPEGADVPDADPAVTGSIPEGHDPLAADADVGANAPESAPTMTPSVSMSAEDGAGAAHSPLDWKGPPSVASPAQDETSDKGDAPADKPEGEADSKGNDLPETPELVGAKGEGFTHAGTDTNEVLISRPCDPVTGKPLDGKQASTYQPIVGGSGGQGASASGQVLQVPPSEMAEDGGADSKSESGDSNAAAYGDDSDSESEGLAEEVSDLKSDLKSLKSDVKHILKTLKSMMKHR